MHSSSLKIFRDLLGGLSDTMIRFPAADTFSVETAGSERLRISSSGKVGIDMTNPDAYDKF